LGKICWRGVASGSGAGGAEAGFGISSRGLDGAAFTVMLLTGMVAF
jgi:hypothetical protein